MKIKIYSIDRNEMSSGGMPSIDAMLGIISNNNQTSAILDNQRAVTESIKNSMERNTQGLSSLVNLDSDRIVNIVDRNNAFANQNLNTLGSGLKDIIQHGFSSDLAAIERTAAANALTTDRVGNNLSSAIERNGSINMNTTERTSAANAIASERIGGQLATLVEKNNREIMSGFKENMLTSERNFGETKLFNATQNQFIERKIGEYYVQSERNFGKLENDLSRVENSIGRLIDNHHNLTMMEMLKMNNGLEKSIANSELTIVKQAADNYANTQIEAAKNKLSLEQKITEVAGEIKLANIKDNNDTRALINNYNNDNVRFDLQSERIIHALHHHHPHHHHHDRHDRDYHHHYYNNFDGRRRGGRGDGD
jgi:uncharacterized protein (DUF488 family)